MPIPVTCPCGKNYQAKDELAGRQLKCPACGQVLVVPALPSPGIGGDLGDASGFDMSGTHSNHTLRPTGAGRPGTARRGAARAANNGFVWKVGAAVAGGLVAVIALAVVMFLVFAARDGGPDGDVATADSLQESEGPHRTPDEPASVPGTSAGGSSEATATAQRFPSLPGAVSNPPAYLLEDAPFDMRTYFGPLPAEQNAAPLYLDALFEFSADVSGCFSAAEQARRGPTIQQRQQRSYAIHNRRSQNEDGVAGPELDRALQEYAAGFAKLEAAQQRPGCVFESALGIAALLPHAQAAREVARWTDIKTQRDVEQGRLDEALENIDLLLRLSRDLQRRGASVTQLVSVAIDSVCYQGCVKRVLADQNLTTDHCDRLLAILARHEQQAVDPLVESLRGEYVIMRSTLHDVRFQTGDFDPKFMREELEVDSIGALITGLAPGGSGSDQEAARIDAYAARMTDDDYTAEITRANELYEAVIAAAGRPYAERVQAIAAAFARVRSPDTLLVSLLSGGLPEILQAFVRSEAELHGTQCLVALRRWLLDQPAVQPPDLVTVVKAAGMPSVPRDPYDDGPLRMTQQQGQLVIYSVGSDGRDDQARSDWQYGKQPGDFIFRLARD